jgi:hypothetical protein
MVFEITSLEGKAVGKKLAPQQLAVSVSDGCAIITSALQCVYGI